MSHRVERVNSLIRHELSELLRREIKDPALSGMISITAVETASDLKYAKVFVSSLGGVTERDEVLGGLRRAGGFIRTELAKDLDLRYVPELDFRWDESLEQGAHLLELLDKVKAPTDNPSK
ncbi:MAG: 30S ribosome-binding factor RbfA [Dehalococcoidia bacterium]|nr:30S ribosome-binding factor RbfA [Dehalococcoidia bacterium]